MKHKVEDGGLWNLRTSGSSWSEWIQMDVRWLSGLKYGRPSWAPRPCSHLMLRLAMRIISQKTSGDFRLWPLERRNHLRFFGKLILKFFVFPKTEFLGCKTWFHVSPDFRKSSNFRRWFSFCLARDWAVKLRQTTDHCLVDWIAHAHHMFLSLSIYIHYVKIYRTTETMQMYICGHVDMYICMLYNVM